MVVRDQIMIEKVQEAQNVDARAKLLAQILVTVRVSADNTSMAAVIQGRINQYALDSQLPICGLPDSILLSVQLVDDTLAARNSYNIILYVTCIGGGTFIAVFAIISFSQKKSGDDMLIPQTVLSLRKQLMIRQSDGFLLSTERAPIWRKQQSFTIIQKQHLEAAARLTLFREDFDVKHVDGFCLCLQSTSSEQRIRIWLLKLGRDLLNPDDMFVEKPDLDWDASNKESNLNLVDMVAAFFACVEKKSNRVIDVFHMIRKENAESWLKKSSQEQRFMYFKTKVAKLSMFSKENKTLFSEIKSIANEYMDQIANECNSRFKEMLDEQNAQMLLTCHIKQGVQIDRVCSSPRFGYSPVIKAARAELDFQYSNFSDISEELECTQIS